MNRQHCLPITLIAVVFLSVLPAQETSKSVVTGYAHYFLDDPPRIVRGQILTLRTRGLLPQVLGKPKKTDETPSFEENGLRVVLDVQGYGSWELPILGANRNPFRSADHAELTVQIPTEIPDRVVSLPLVPRGVFRPRISIVEHGVKGFATEFQWNNAVPRILNYCELIVDRPAEFNCGPWMTDTNGEPLRAPTPGAELVFVVNGLNITDPVVPSGVLFSEPLPKPRSRVFVGFAQSATKPPFHGSQVEYGWVEATVVPKLGHLSVFEVKFQFPEKLPFATPTGECVEVNIYLRAGDGSTADQFSQAESFDCVKFQE